MLYAMVCCIAVAVGLFVFYTLKEKKAEKAALLTQEEIETIKR
jgi:Na+/H+ antiporter NhaC